MNRHFYHVVATRAGQPIIAHKTNSHSEAIRYARKVRGTVIDLDDTAPVKLKNLGDGCYQTPDGAYVVEKDWSIYDNTTFWNVKAVQPDGFGVLLGETETLTEARRFIARHQQGTATSI